MLKCSGLGATSLRATALGAGTLLALSAGLAGCAGIHMDAGTAAQVRIIDASPDAPAIDSYQNSAALAYNLGFGTGTSYVPLASGSYTLAADKAGTRQALISSAASFSAGHQYTAIIGNINAALQQTLLLDQSQPAPVGETAVRLLDEATRAGAVDVYLIPRGGKLSTSSPIASGLSFGANAGYLNLSAGVYELAVVPAGTAPASSTVTLLSGAQSQFASGEVRTEVLIDEVNAYAVRIRARAKRAARCRVRAAGDAGDRRRRLRPCHGVMPLQRQPGFVRSYFHGSA